MAKNILNDVKNIRNNEVAVTSAISYMKEFVKRKFNEIISIHDHKLKADELVRDKDFTPRMLDADTKTLQYSIAGALVTANIGGNANALSVEAGSFIDHSFYAKDRKIIAAIKAIPETYDPSRSWVVSATNLTIANNNGHWLYLKVPTAVGLTSSELFASESHIDPLRDEGYIIYKWGHVHPVVNGSREVSMTWGNVKSATHPPVTIATASATRASIGADQKLTIEPVKIEDVEGSSGIVTVKLGFIYNDLAANDERKLTSSDEWRISRQINFDHDPDSDWAKLMNYTGVGYAQGDCGWLKETATVYWNSPNTGATNTSKFNARAGGYRRGDVFYGLGEQCVFGDGNYWGGQTVLRSDSSSLGHGSSGGYLSGSYLRLVRISTSLEPCQEGTYTGNDGKIYRTICILSLDGATKQEWLADNLCETEFRTKDKITEGITGWDDSIPMRCSYNNDESLAFETTPGTPSLSEIIGDLQNKQHNSFSGIDGGDPEADYFGHLTEGEKSNLHTPETDTTIAAIITGAEAITTPLDADEIPIYKKVGTTLKKVTWANIVTTLSNIFVKSANTFAGGKILKTIGGSRNVEEAEISIDLANNMAGVNDLSTNSLHANQITTVGYLGNIITFPENYYAAVGVEPQSYLSTSPLSKYLWHDILAFGTHLGGQPLFEKYIDESWVSSDLDTGLFAQQSSRRVFQINGITETKARWTWHGNGKFSYSFAEVWLISVAYSTIPVYKNIMIESSIDGIVWKVKHTSTGNLANCATIMIVLRAYVFDGDSYIRLSIEVTNLQPLFLSSMKALTTRADSAGGGSELEFPYRWDANKNMFFDGEVTINKTSPDVAISVLGRDENGKVTANVPVPIISSGTAPPTSTPAKIGNTFIDTANEKIYMATGTTSAADWTPLN